ncbi:hypothetical protein [Streptomyces wuyuanensis]|uniref:hypothetical protein n=1 Tax=Streptomyces wuyuanensis TaxID=1196353 RepID=UPI003424B69F
MSQEFENARHFIVITPGIDRFGYFRNLDQIRAGRVTPADMADLQEKYDNWSLDSAVWKAAREPRS